LQVIESATNSTDSGICVVHREVDSVWVEDALVKLSLDDRLQSTGVGKVTGYVKGNFKVYGRVELGIDWIHRHAVDANDGAVLTNKKEGTGHVWAESLYYINREKSVFSGVIVRLAHFDCREKGNLQ